MNDFAIFEFTQKLFNERALSSFVYDVLMGLSTNNDKLSDQLFDYHVPAEEYIKTDKYASDIQKAIEARMQNDYNKIFSIINASLLKKEELPQQFISVVKQTAENLKIKSLQPQIHSYFKHIASSLDKFLQDLKDNFPEDILVLNKEIEKSIQEQNEEAKSTQEMDPKLFIKYFKSKKEYDCPLTTKEVALLLHLLTTEGIIPSYTNQKLGIIGRVLFHLDNSNIAQSLGQDVNHKPKLKTEITNLSNIIQSLRIRLDEWKKI